MKILTSLLLLAVFASCKKDPAPGLEAAEQKAGYVTGKITNAQGGPVRGAKVFASHDTWYNTHVIGNTDDAGNFKLRLDNQPGGTWSVYAQHQVNYNNKVYTFDLRPENTAHVTNEGGLRNLQWKLTGVIPGSTTDTRLGGYVTFYVDSRDYVPVTDVELTLTPQGPLVDGTQGSVIVRRGENFPTRIFGFYMDHGLRDVPVGRYTVTAKYKPVNGPAKDMTVSLQGSGDYKTALTADFVQESFSSFQELPLNVKLEQ